MDKGFIVIIFQDKIPEYTIDEVFTDPEDAKKAGEEALQEVLDEIEEKKQAGQSYDTGKFTMKVVDLSK